MGIANWYLYSPCLVILKHVTILDHSLVTWEPFILYTM